MEVKNSYRPRRLNFGKDKQKIMSSIRELDRSLREGKGQRINPNTRKMVSVASISLFYLPITFFFSLPQ
jgi:hypothetical protein